MDLMERSQTQGLRRAKGRWTAGRYMLVFGVLFWGRDNDDWVVVNKKKRLMVGPSLSKKNNSKAGLVLIGL